MTSALRLAPLLLLAAQAPVPTPAPAPVTPLAPLPADQAAMRAHVLFLASDAMKGREAGSPEYDIAAQYVAAQFSAAGLRPAGDAGGYLQNVPLVTYRPSSEGVLRWTPAGGSTRTLEFGKDYIPLADPRATRTVLDAQVVFVGYGISAPALDHDDYAGMNVKGKIVAFVGGTPSLGNGEIEASFTRDARLRAAQAHGAVGAIGIADIASGRGADFAASVKRWDRAATTWADASGKAGGPATRGVPMVATMSPAGMAKMFGPNWPGTPPTTDPAARPRFVSAASGGRLSVRTTTSFVPATSSNVVGMIPGSDPKSGEEVVVLSAHLDHIGVSPANGSGGEGDRINNGALDNAIGIASLIEEAKRFAASGRPPKRSVLFLAVTAEEKGLIGADYFASNPTVPLETIVADVNLDMPVLLYRFEDMTVFGAERSTLGPIVRRAVQSAGVDLTPDQNPDQAFFVRSDHYRFVERGIPSVFLWPGQKGDGGRFQAFLRTCYHRPCDDAGQPILWDQGVRFVDVNYRIAREIADADARPVWNKGDWFGRLYKGPMAR